MGRRRCGSRSLGKPGTCPSARMVNWPSRHGQDMPRSHRNGSRRWASRASPIDDSFFGVAGLGSKSTTAGSAILKPRWAMVLKVSPVARATARFQLVLSHSLTPWDQKKAAPPRGGRGKHNRPVQGAIRRRHTHAASGRQECAHSAARRLSEESPSRGKPLSHRVN